MHPHRMSIFLSFRSLFRSNSQTDNTTANYRAVDSLIEQGMNPAQLEWYALNGFPNVQKQRVSSPETIVESKGETSLDALPLAS